MPPHTYSLSSSTTPQAVTGRIAAPASSSPIQWHHHDTNKPHNNNIVNLLSIQDLSHGASSSGAAMPTMASVDSSNHIVNMLSDIFDRHNSVTSNSGAAQKKMAIVDGHVNQLYHQRSHTHSLYDLTTATAAASVDGATRWQCQSPDLAFLLGSSSFKNEYSPAIITSPVFTQHADNDLAESSWADSPTTDSTAPAQPPLDRGCNDNTDDDMLFWKHNPIKPPIPYRSLVTKSLQTAGAQGSTLKDMYDWIEANFLYFSVISEQGNGASWRSSVRHNLVSHDEFVRVGGCADDDDAADSFNETKAGKFGGAGGRRARWTLSPDYVERANASRPGADSPTGIMGDFTLGVSTASTKPKPRSVSKSAIRAAKSALAVYAGDACDSGDSSTTCSPRKTSRQRSISVSGSKMRRGVSVPLVFPYPSTASREAPATLPTMPTEPRASSAPTLPEGISLESILGSSPTFASMGLSLPAAERSPSCATTSPNTAAQLQLHHTMSSASSTMSATYPASNVDDHFIMAKFHARAAGTHQPTRPLLVTPATGELSDAEINNIAMWLLDQ